MLLYLAVPIGIAVGVGIAFQTSINSVLRKSVVSTCFINTVLIRTCRLKTLQGRFKI